MTLPPLFEFGKLLVVDSGIATMERVVFRPTEPLNLAQYGLIRAWKRDDGTIHFLNGDFFWFGEIFVTPPCWIAVYTGKGTTKVEQSFAQPVYCFYWGLECSSFTVSNQIPILVKFSSIQVGEHLKAIPSFEEQKRQKLLNSPST